MSKMHEIALVVFVLIALFIIFREGFVSSFNDMINRAVDPIFVSYRGRERDWKGMDYYDHFLNNQLVAENLSASQIRYNL